MLQGMPRRISDYPDAYAGWNFISSFGSIISIIATVLFLQVLFKQLTDCCLANPVTRNQWSIPELFYDILRLDLNRINSSLEWCLQSPPKPHAFVSLPLQNIDEKIIITLLGVNALIKKPVLTLSLLAIGIILPVISPMVYPMMGYEYTDPAIGLATDILDIASDSTGIAPHPYFTFHGQNQHVDARIWDFIRSDGRIPSNANVSALLTNIIRSIWIQEDSSLPTIEWGNLLTGTNSEIREKLIQLFRDLLNE